MSPPGPIACRGRQAGHVDERFGRSVSPRPTNLTTVMAAEHGYRPALAR